mmetsp:Transcript_125706/g.367277  ORF Transcript_125706/g.367277 Transcript_125706/m.367277 type:complete len:320 (+) Transcript_125706:833-1792(+)
MLVLGLKLPSLGSVVPRELALGAQLEHELLPPRGAPPQLGGDLAQPLLALLPGQLGGGGPPPQLRDLCLLGEVLCLQAPRTCPGLGRLRGFPRALRALRLQPHLESPDASFQLGFALFELRASRLFFSGNLEALLLQRLHHLCRGRRPPEAFPLLLPSLSLQAKVLLLSTCLLELRLRGRKLAQGPAHLQLARFQCLLNTRLLLLSSNNGLLQSLQLRGRRAPLLPHLEVPAPQRRHAPPQPLGLRGEALCLALELGAMLLLVVARGALLLVVARGALLGLAVSAALISGAATLLRVAQGLQHEAEFLRQVRRQVVHQV